MLQNSLTMARVTRLSSPAFLGPVLIKLWVVCKMVSSTTKKLSMHAMQWGEKTPYPNVQAWIYLNSPNYAIEKFLVVTDLSFLKDKC